MRCFTIMSSPESDRRSYLLGLKIMGDFGASIAVPVVVLVLIGKWLQEKYHFAPFGIIGGFLIAAAITVYIIRKKAAWYAAEYKSLQTPSASATRKPIIEEKDKSDV